MSDEWVVTMPKLGETVTEGTIGSWLKPAGDECRVRRPAVRGVDRQGRLGDPQPVRRRAAGDPGARPGETVPVGTPLVRIGPPGSVRRPRRRTRAVDVPAAGAPAADRAAASGRGAGGPRRTRGWAARRGMAGEDPEVSTPDGVVHDITMPKLGETVTEGTVGSWLKQVGDTIEMDDPLFEVSTDKVDSEIPSPYDGVLLEILVPAGETVAGRHRRWRGSASRAPRRPAAPAPVATGAIAGRAPVPAAPAAAPAAVPADAAPLAADGNGRMLSPLVRRLVAEAGLDVATIPGTGAGGRIRREDVQKAAAAAGQAAAAAPAGAAAAPAAPAPAPAAAPAPAPAAAPSAAPAAAGADPRDEVVELSRMRLAVAAGMKASQSTTASVWTSVEVDFDNVEKVRQQAQGPVQEGDRLVAVLPAVHRPRDDRRAAGLPHGQLLDRHRGEDDDPAPVRQPGHRGRPGPAGPGRAGGEGRRRAEHARHRQGHHRAWPAAARNKKLGMADMQGSTFTITNPGPFASYASAPIINQPNVAILCTDGVKRRPVAVGDAIAIHPTGIIGLVYDHRAFDGSTASLFLRTSATRSSSATGRRRSADMTARADRAAGGTGHRHDRPSGRAGSGGRLRALERRAHREGARRSPGSSAPGCCARAGSVSRGT